MPWNRVRNLDKDGFYAFTKSSRLIQTFAPHTMKITINIILIVIGILILGAIRVDVYIAHGFPYAMLSIMLLSIMVPWESIGEALLTVWMLSFYFTIVFLIFAWRSPRYRALFGCLAMLSACASACFMLWMASGSGYTNRETYITSTVAMVVLMPNLLFMTIRGANNILHPIAASRGKG